MSWTRLDDRWAERPVLARLPYEARWHYLAMIQFCSRNDRIDGRLTIKDATRCSDVDDPGRIVQDLLDVSLLALDDGWVRLVEIDDHIPPPSVRQKAENDKIRKRRERAHKAGDHSLCLPDHCTHATVTRDISRDPGTGQDRTGRPKGEGSSDERIDKVTGEVFPSSASSSSPFVSAYVSADCDHPLKTSDEVQRDMCNHCWVKADGAKKMAASGWAT